MCATLSSSVTGVHFCRRFRRGSGGSGGGGGGGGGNDRLECGNKGVMVGGKNVGDLADLFFIGVFACVIRMNTPSGIAFVLLTKLSA